MKTDRRKGTAEFHAARIKAAAGEQLEQIKSEAKRDKIGIRFTTDEVQQLKDFANSHSDGKLMPMLYKWIMERFEAERAAAAEPGNVPTAGVLQPTRPDPLHVALQNLTIALHASGYCAPAANSPAITPKSIKPEVVPRGQPPEGR